MASYIENLAAQDPRMQALAPLYRPQNNGSAFRWQNLLTAPPRQTPQGNPAQQPGPQASPTDPNEAGILDRLFGGQYDPNLSPEQNRAAARQALMIAGLQGIMASRSAPGMPAPGTLQVLAQSALTGQQAGAGIRSGMSQELAQLEYRDAMRRAMGTSEKPSISQLQAAHAVALQYGDIGAAQTLQAELNRRQRESGGPASQWVRFQGQDGQMYALDQATGEVRPLTVDGQPVTGPQDEADTEQRLTRIGTYEDPQTGEPFTGGYNPQTGQIERIGGGAIPESQSAGTEGQRKARAFLSFIPDHVDYIDQLEGAPGRGEAFLTDKGVRELTSTEQQQLDLAGAALAEAWLRMTTGAAYTPTELRNAKAMFIPQPGDKAETLEAKRENRNRLMTMLRALAGQTGAPDSSGDGLGSFGDLPEAEGGR